MGSPLFCFFSQMSPPFFPFRTPTVFGLFRTPSCVFFFFSRDPPCAPLRASPDVKVSVFSPVWFPSGRILAQNTPFFSFTFPFCACLILAVCSPEFSPFPVCFFSIETAVLCWWVSLFFSFPPPTGRTFAKPCFHPTASHLISRLPPPPPCPTRPPVFWVPFKRPPYFRFLCALLNQT